MKRTIVAISVTAALLVAGCSSSDDETSESSTGPTAVANFEGSSSACDHSQTFTTPDLETALKAAPLPDGVRLVNEQSVGNIDTPGEIDVVVRICQSGLTGDLLKDAATVVAQAVKASAVSDQVASLRVSNTAEDSNPEGKVRVDDFGLHTFSTTADRGAVRAGWLYPSEGQSDVATVKKYPTSRGTRWMARYREPDGRQTDDKRGLLTKTAADAWLQETEVSKRRGGYIEQSLGRPRARVLYEQWYADKVDIEQNSRRPYRQTLDHQVLPRWGDISIADIHIADIQLWISGLDRAPRLCTKTPRAVDGSRSRGARSADPVECGDWRESATTGE